MLIERIWKKKQVCFPCSNRIRSVLGWLYTMSVVYFGWILFRLADLKQSIYFFKVLFGIATPDFIPYNIGWYLNKRTLFILTAAILCCVPWKEIAEKRIPQLKQLWEHSLFIIVKRSALLCLLVICLILITNSTYNPFIYFRF